MVIWTGYGSAAYRHLSAAVGDVKRIDPLAPVTVLVPTNICGIVARRRLAEGVGGRAGVAGLTVLTVDRLAERLAAPALVGTGRRPDDRRRTRGGLATGAWPTKPGSSLRSPGTQPPSARWSPRTGNSATWTRRR